jgi:hypothetical protein
MHNPSAQCLEMVCVHNHSAQSQDMACMHNHSAQSQDMVCMHNHSAQGLEMVCLHNHSAQSLETVCMHNLSAQSPSFPCPVLCPAAGAPYPLGCSSEWHVYGVELKESGIRFYIDNTTVYEVEPWRWNGYYKVGPSPCSTYAVLSSSTFLVAVLW